MKLSSAESSSLRPACAFLLLFTSLAAAAQGETAIIFRKVAAVGDAAPGGGTLSSLDSPSIAPPAAAQPPGPVAFHGDTGAGGGIFLHDGQTLTAVARKGDPVPGVATTFWSFELPVLSQAGTVGFAAQYQPSLEELPPGIHGLFRGPQLALVGSIHDSAPGFAAPKIYYAFEPMPLLVQSQMLGFYSRVRDDTLPAGAPEEPGLMRTSSPTVGSPIVAPFGSHILGLNAAGEACWYEPGAIRSTLGLMVEQGDPAPGGGVFSSVDFAPTINSSGIVAFYAKTDSDTGGGIWRTVGADALEAVVRDGDVAPGTGGSAVFSGVGDPALNDGDTAGNSRVSFSAYLEGAGVGTTDDFAIYVESSSGLELVAREGSPTPRGGTFRRDDDPSPFLDPHLNADGHVAFQGWADGTVRGIWASDGTGAVVNVALAGDTVFIRGAGARTFDDLAFGAQDRSGDGVSKALNTGNADGRASVWSTAGEVVFEAQIGGNTWIVAAVVTCKGDLDGDLVVDGSDQSELFAAWGSCPGPCPADLDGDGDVDGADLAALLARWGPCS